MKKILGLTALTLILGVSGVAIADHHKGEKGERYQHKFEKFDKDGDGKLSKEEYLSIHADRFDKLDGDKDGFITKEDMKNMKKKAKKHCDKMRGKDKGKEGKSSE